MGAPRAASATLLVDHPVTIFLIISVNVRRTGALQTRATPSRGVYGRIPVRRLAIALTWTLQRLPPLKAMGPAATSTSISANANRTGALQSRATPSRAASGQRLAPRAASATLLVDHPVPIFLIISVNVR